MILTRWRPKQLCEDRLQPIRPHMTDAEGQLFDGMMNPDKLRPGLRAYHGRAFYRPALPAGR